MYILVMLLQLTILSVIIQVHPTAGNLSLKQPINHTEYPTATFTVVARDGGSPPLEDRATVEIDVIECNAHRPQFAPSFYDMELRADVDVGTSLFTLRSWDPDSGQ
jgi:hypothetical protein